MNRPILIFLLLLVQVGPLGLPTLAPLPPLSPPPNTKIRLFLFLNHTYEPVVGLLPPVSGSQLNLLLYFHSHATTTLSPTCTTPLLGLNMNHSIGITHLVIPSKELCYLDFMPDALKGCYDIEVPDIKVPEKNDIEVPATLSSRTLSMQWWSEKPTSST